jgi:hypothetical protein
MRRNEIQEFAGDVRVGPAARPRWITTLAYCLVVWGLGYFIWTAGGGGLGGPNWVIWVLLALWLAYTPLAVRKKWFAIRL